MRCEHLIIFLKAPREGLVKTRLARAIGPEAACDAYRQLIGVLVSSLAILPEVELRFAPDDAVSEIRAWQQPTWDLRGQGEGDLGDRLQSAFANAFAGGAERVVIIGSDCPSVVVQDIEAAWGALRDHELVLGPARDGGYWLIGLNQPEPGLFRKMTWSTETVLHETVRRAQGAGLTVKLLQELADVDDERDWEEFVGLRSMRKMKP